jgi:hypothetical protein
VEDRFQLLCDGRVRFTLTAPEGMTLRLEVLSAEGEVLSEGVSADGLPATVELREPACFVDDSTTLEVVVRPVGSDRTGEPYLLERDGSW